MKKLLLGLGTIAAVAAPVAAVVACSGTTLPSEELLGDVVHANLKLNINGVAVTGKALDVIAIKAEYNPSFETAIVNLQLRNGMIGFIKTTLMAGKNSNGFPIMWGREWTPHTLYFSETSNAASLGSFIDANIDWAFKNQSARDGMNAINVNPEAIEFNMMGVWNKQALYY